LGPLDPRVSATTEWRARRIRAETTILQHREDPYDEPRFAERRADTRCRREGYPRCRRNHFHFDEAVRRARDPALEVWHGRDENLASGQHAFDQRARANGAASVGQYTDEKESASPGAYDPPSRRDWRDDGFAGTAPALRSATIWDSKEEMMANVLSDTERARMDAYWRAANYLSVGQIYLYDNPLLKQTLTKGVRSSKNVTRQLI
jgi:hypothetical protein